MLLLTMMLILTVTHGQSYPTGPLTFYAEGEAPEETALRVLRGLELMSSSGAPANKPSVHLPAEEANPPLSRGLPRSAWWWHPEMLHPEMKRRNNLASYNLNSFGLRYGK
ncbi:metastasis-suppressor KiSS-1 [Salminus brasiliensis]|uniref:metastasis-suppressor KiSS-1 n=1 Tax=Salminus brasiliensis TaxID=930266 RepID=UPI003B830B4C